MAWKKILLEGDAAELSDVAPNTIEPDDTPSAGVATLASRQDHEHGLAADVPGTIGESDTPAEGTATSVARSDHVHGSPASYTPAAHTLDSHSDPTANVEIAGFQPLNMVIHTVADAIARDALTAVVGKVAWQTDTLHPYICTAV